MSEGIQAMNAVRPEKLEEMAQRRGRAIRLQYRAVQARDRAAKHWERVVVLRKELAKMIARATR